MQDIHIFSLSINRKEKFLLEAETNFLMASSHEDLGSTGKFLANRRRLSSIFTSRAAARSSRGFRCCPCWEDVFLGNFRCWPCWEDDFLFLCLQIDILLVGKTIFVSLFSSSHAIQYLLLLVHFF